MVPLETGRLCDQCHFHGARDKGRCKYVKNHEEYLRVLSLSFEVYLDFQSRLDSPLLRH